jgi:hypothetical protein
MDERILTERDMERINDMEERKESHEKKNMDGGM